MNWNFRKHALLIISAALLKMKNFSRSQEIIYGNGARDVVTTGH